MTCSDVQTWLNGPSNTIVIAPGTQHAAFNGTYMALLSAPRAPAAPPTAPVAGESSKPQTQ